MKDQADKGMELMWQCSDDAFDEKNISASIPLSRSMDKLNLTLRDVPRSSDTININLNISIASSLPVDSNTFAKTKAQEETRVAKRRAFVIVDPWSTGTRLCHEIVAKNFDLIIVWPEKYLAIRSKTLPAKESVVHIDSDVGYLDTVLRLKALRNKQYDILAILPGSETGVMLAEKLAFTMGLPTNAPSLALARRNKYMMGEALRAKGVRAVQQTIAFDMKTVSDFIERWNPDPFLVIVKPNMGAGSDDVYLCKNMTQVETAFNKIFGAINSLGIKNEGVLVQEYLDGIEYVIDTLSVRGSHRIVSIWEYDKREANGRFNVYYGNFPLVMETNLDSRTRMMETYVFKVLDALGFKNGPGHAEIKFTKTGPCLVEIGARCHGGNATWVDVARSCWGFDQISCLIDAFDKLSQQEPGPDQASSESIAEFPLEFKKCGVVLDMVAYEGAKILSIPGEQSVRNMKSFFSIDFYKKVGENLVPTVDCNTSPGQVILIHQSRKQVRSDYDAIHKMLQTKNSFFVTDAK